MEDMIKKLKELVNENYSSSKCGWTSERSAGNYDDCFDDGFDCGQSVLAYELGKILGMELEEPEEPNYD